MSLVDSIKAHEGFRARAYQDSVGVWTVGYGTNLQRLTIDEATAEQWLLRELARLREFFELHQPYPKLSPARQDVILEMAYNLGIAGVLAFGKMWTALAAGDWDEAARQMLDSKWAKQVGQRAQDLAGRMRAG